MKTVLSNSPLAAELPSLRGYTRVRESSLGGPARLAARRAPALRSDHHLAGGHRAPGLPCGPGRDMLGRTATGRAEQDQTSPTSAAAGHSTITESSDWPSSPSCIARRPPTPNNGEYVIDVCRCQP